MRAIIEKTDNYELLHCTGQNKFKGCQCYGNCSCYENFYNSPDYKKDYSYYAVIKKINKPRTHYYNTIEEARVRCEFLNTLTR